MFHTYLKGSKILKLIFSKFPRSNLIFLLSWLYICQTCASNTILIPATSNCIYIQFWLVCAKKHALRWLLKKRPFLSHLYVKDRDYGNKKFTLGNLKHKKMNRYYVHCFTIRLPMSTKRFKNFRHAYPL